MMDALIILIAAVAIVWTAYRMIARMTWRRQNVSRAMHKAIRGQIAGAYCGQVLDLSTHSKTSIRAWDGNQWVETAR